MTAAEFLAESKRIEYLRGYLARDEREAGESAARDTVRELLHRHDRMREALEAVLVLHRPMNILGSPPCAQCLGDEDGESVFVLWPCPTVRAIESALAENGGEK